MKKVYITIYTKEKGRIKLSYEEWMGFKLSPYTIHKEDGPAIEYSIGTKAWYIDGESHREDGPAVDWANGTKEWFINGKRHRLDGPAIERFDESMTWYVDDESYSKEEFDQIINEAKALPLELRLTDPRWWVREMK